MPTWILTAVKCFTAMLVLFVCSQMFAAPPIELGNASYDPACGIQVEQDADTIQVTWPHGDRRLRMEFDLSPDKPLIRSWQRSGDEGRFHEIAGQLDPVLLMRVGNRDIDKRDGWTIFFDRMQEKPSQLYKADIRPMTATVASQSRRATLTIGPLTAGPFHGDLRWTFYAGNPFVLQEAVVSTKRKRTAFLYDMGLACRGATPDRMTWVNPDGSRINHQAATIDQARAVAVRGRSVAASFEGGALAVFPPPHRFFYPLDFSDNLQNIWVGPQYSEGLAFGFGIRHNPRGDNRFVPWFNAPPETRQELGMFLLVDEGSANDALDEVAKLTRKDRFDKLPGHVVFSSHYHVEHTRELLDAQSKDSDVGGLMGQLPSGDNYKIPMRLEQPGFVRTFREMGVDIVHLAEFHFGSTPGMDREQRLARLQLLHAECARLSDDHFLLLPGEEPNVHLGGHWISFFPKPVYWVLNRKGGEPFVEDHPGLGPVYHVGNEADVLRLLRAEKGLAWTAHPRIKGSTGFPDRYRDRPFFQSEQFLGGAWKSMPADLSQPQLGSRVLGLLDDMSNWGVPKYVPGEVDVFKIEPSHELYGHMNVNYLRLAEISRFQDGWSPVLQSLRQGQFFVTTGEVLIPECVLCGERDFASGEAASLDDPSHAKLRLRLKWTFPLAYASIVSGDGVSVKRRRLDLSATGAFGEGVWEQELDLSGQRWVRVEVWDVATNGAFTQPIWLR